MSVREKGNVFLAFMLGTAFGALVLSGMCLRAEEWEGDYNWYLRDSTPNVQRQYHQDQNDRTQSLFNQNLRERLGMERPPC